MREWKPVIGYEKFYSISNDGQLVRTATFGGNPRWKICAPRLKNGYTVFHPSIDGREVDLFAHRLVWEAFVGPIPVAMTINHKNGKRSDNRLSNLEVCTQAYNVAHGFRVNGRKPANNPNYGSKNGAAKLSEEQIPKIRELYLSGIYQKDIGKMFGVSQRMISLIVRGEKWRHVTATPQVKD